METADSIVKHLGLSDQGVGLEQILTALRRLNIHVLFYDFGDKEAQAVCVKKGEKSVILVNSNELVEDVCWRILHEVTHLFCGHERPSREDEVFCNKVATEIVTPAHFFKKHKDFFKNKFSGQATTEHLLIIDEIMRRFGGGFFGVVLRLKETKSLSKPLFETFKAMWEKRKLSQELKVSSIFRPKNGESSVDLWKRVLGDRDKDKYLHFQELVVKGVVMGKVSYSRASELLEPMDVMSIQELSNWWKEEFEDRYAS